MARKPTVVFGLLGTTLDEGRGPKRWERWRPTVALCRHPDLLVDRLELIHDRRHTALAETVAADIARVSPETTVVRHLLEISRTQKTSNNDADRLRKYLARFELVWSDLKG